MTTDRLVFRRAPGDGTGQLTTPWPGAWPPPARVVMIDGAAIVDAADPGAGGLRLLRSAEFQATHKVVEYIRNAASHIHEPAPEGATWFRGAEYVEAASVEP